MSWKKSPVVDDSDVNRIVDLIRQHADFTRATPEARADHAHQVALSEGELMGHSPEWSQELARKVRQRMMWAKPSSDNPHTKPAET